MDPSSGGDYRKPVVVPVVAFLVAFVFVLFLPGGGLLWSVPGTCGNTRAGARVGAAAGERAEGREVALRSAVARGRGARIHGNNSHKPDLKFLVNVSRFSPPSRAEERTREVALTRVLSAVVAGNMGELRVCDVVPIGEMEELNVYAYGVSCSCETGFYCRCRTAMRICVRFEWHMRNRAGVLPPPLDGVEVALD
ncbi:hypothetical protein FIBSPDRAFT_882934 [Athelia psychrophila]|uniref:Uncharacterized protein n=1 Tax=Athelia psychrophila TaxID=1759441 RepID=A0A166UVY7_9AGAM|nr:hypothetical protein FIBSPDRAFT_882934 [Fibularhizoctonia sp. CBS 109695]